MSTRYHGFTCPNCGSHRFTTFSNRWVNLVTDSKWPEGTQVGACTRYYVEQTDCRFQWDRNDKATEDKVLFFPSMEEHMASYKKSDEVKGAS